MATSRNLLITTVENFASHNKESARRQVHKVSSQESHYSSFKKPSTNSYRLPAKFVVLSIHKHKGGVNTPRVMNSIWNNLSLTQGIAKENKSIRKKIEEYESFSTTRY